jgi:uncharacterized protein YdhG (YjbR/CyaY superfamily)
MKAVDQYLAKQPDAARRVLARVRTVIGKALPRAVEEMAYGMPAFTVDGRAVLYFAAWKQHWSLYPASARVVAELGDAVAPYVAEKGTLRFSYDDTLPVHLLSRIAKVRALEVAARSKASAKVATKKKAAPRKKKAAPRKKKATTRKKRRV